MSGGKDNGVGTAVLCCCEGDFLMLQHSFQILLRMGLIADHPKSLTFMFVYCVHGDHDRLGAGETSYIDFYILHNITYDPVHPS